MCVFLTYSAIKLVQMMYSNALNSRGKPAVSPMSAVARLSTREKKRNGATLKLCHALREGGVITLNYL